MATPLQNRRGGILQKPGLLPNRTAIGTEYGDLVFCVNVTIWIHQWVKAQIIEISLHLYFSSPGTILDINKLLIHFFWKEWMDASVEFTVQGFKFFFPANVCLSAAPPSSSCFLHICFWIFLLEEYSYLCLTELISPERTPLFLPFSIVQMLYQCRMIGAR